MNKETFKEFLNIVADQELSPIQLEQFKLEADDIITIMFQSETIDELKRHGSSQGLDFGLSAEAVTEISKSLLDFSSLIISGFTLYLEFRRYKKEQLEEKKKNVEENWKKILETEKLKPEVAERIAKKYSDAFIKSMK